MNLHIGMAWKIRCCSSRFCIFIDPIKKFHNWWITFVTTPQIIDTSQSPTFKSGLFGLSAVSVNWPSTSDNLFTVISQLIAAITTLPPFGSMLLSTIKMSPSLMCGSIDCLRHGRRRWRSRWSLAVHWDQSSRPIRRTEAKDCACAEALILEVEGVFVPMVTCWSCNSEDC